MFVIMAYDVGVKRVSKILKISRRYLLWIQNSVFEGEITPGKFKAQKNEINAVINDDEDSVIFYVWPSKLYSHRESLGMSKEFINDLTVI